MSGWILITTHDPRAVVFMQESYACMQCTGALALFTCTTPPHDSAAAADVCARSLDTRTHTHSAAALPCCCSRVPHEVGNDQ